VKLAKDISSTRVFDSFPRSKAIFCLGKCAFIILVWLRVSETFRENSRDTGLRYSRYYFVKLLPQPFGYKLLMHEQTDDGKFFQ